MQRKINRQGGSKKVFSVDLERFRFGFVSFSNRVLARCKKKNRNGRPRPMNSFNFFFRKKFFCVKVMRLPRNSLSLSERIKSSSNIFYTPSDILWRTDTHTLVHTHAQCSIGRSTRHTVTARTPSAPLQVFWSAERLRMPSEYSNFPFRRHPFNAGPIWSIWIHSVLIQNKGKFRFQNNNQAKKKLQISGTELSHFASCTPIRYSRTLHSVCRGRALALM